MRSLSKPFQLWRFLFFTILLLLFVVGALFWFWKKHKRSIVKQGLEEMVAGNSHGIYNLKIGQLNFDENKGWVRMRSVKLDYDSTRFALMKSSNQGYPILIRLRAGSIDIDGITSGAEINQGIFRGRKMLISNPEIELIYTDEHSVKTIPSKEEIYQQITAGMDLEMDSIIIENASIHTRYFRRSVHLIDADSIVIRLTDVKVNDKGIRDSSRIFFSKKFHFAVGSTSWNAKNGLYHYAVGGIVVNSAGGDVRAAELSITPRIPVHSFFKTRDAGDPLDIRCRDIQLTGVDIPLLVNENLLADRLRIGYGSIKIWHEPGIFSAKRNVALPQTIMTHTPFIFRVKKMFLANGRLEYKERSAITGKTGFIYFNGLNFTVNNFCNDVSVLRSEPEMRMQLNARFQNKLPLNTDWVFRPMDPSGSFSLKGSTGETDAIQFNELLEAMGPAHLESGYINGIEFSLRGSDAGISGQVKFLYQDLKIKLLEQEKVPGKENKKTLTSFLANILIRNDNPKKNKPPRIASVQLARDKSKSLFFLCWKGLFSGLKQSAGIKEKKR